MQEHQVYFALSRPNFIFQIPQHIALILMFATCILMLWILPLTDHKVIGFAIICVLISVCYFLARRKVSQDYYYFSILLKRLKYDRHLLLHKSVKFMRG